MSGDVLSRRISEGTGVALFGVALFWLIAIATYDAADPVWFFKTGGQTVPANLAGRVGAFLAELSHQLLGFAAILVPVTLGALGWHAFWCRPITASYTRFVGLGLMFICTSAFLSLALGSSPATGRAFDAGGILGGLFAAGLSAYFNHAGSLVVVLTLLCLSITLSTQASLGRGFARAGRDGRRSRQERQQLDSSLADRTRQGAPAQGRPEQASGEEGRVHRANGDPGEERNSGRSAP